MAKEAKAPPKAASPKEAPVDLRDFLSKASAPELLELAKNTGLVGHPLVKDYENPQAPDSYHKEQALRKLVHLEQKKHADFRNRLTSLVRQKLPQG
jgi:hypothetical protein